MHSLDGAAQSVLAAQQGDLQHQIAMAIAARRLAAARQQGAAVHALLQDAVHLSKEAGLGETLDVQAG